MAEPNGLPIEVERDAMNGREMPDGLGYAEQWLYQQLRMLYYQYKTKIITREIAAVEKKKMLDQYRHLKFREELGDGWVKNIRQTELARAAYRKERTLENADRLLDAIEGNKRSVTKCD